MAKSANRLRLGLVMPVPTSGSFWGLIEGFRLALEEESQIRLDLPAVIFLHQIHFPIADVVAISL